jgi:hypothetical protein
MIEIILAQQGEGSRAWRIKVFEDLDLSDRIFTHLSIEPLEINESLLVVLKALLLYISYDEEIHISCCKIVFSKDDREGYAKVVISYKEESVEWDPFEIKATSSEQIARQIMENIKSFLSKNINWERV